ncbi:hypothetical protein M422DRAFT_276643 [Sphaerobolus stellatus SS14]|uniref:CHAT domain-containing protein n=1 Tax=Sphaerobolus stellatus (strain SS14) TaxID=990650 RepID=A0A0C9UCT1_SPHS4|nr:hypothetical protein M422DRAFT_276643 [Sphaerobolus stellatus SS14]
MSFRVVSSKAAFWKKSSSNGNAKESDLTLVRYGKCSGVSVVHVAELNSTIRIFQHDITLEPLTADASEISHNVELIVKILVGDEIIFQSNATSMLEIKDFWMFKINSEILEECSSVAIHISDASDNNMSVFHIHPVEVEPGTIIIMADKDQCFALSKQIILLDDGELSFQLKAGFEIQETLDFPLNAHMIDNALIAIQQEKRPISKLRLANIYDSVLYLPESQHMRSHFLKLIGDAHLEQYKAVLKFQEAVQLTPDGHPSKPLRLNNLRNSLLTQFEQLGDMTDLNQSVLKLQEAFEQLGDMTDLNQSVLKLQEAFEQLGDMTDLNQSVLKFQKAVQLTPDGHPSKPSMLINLGDSYITRFLKQRLSQAMLGAVQAYSSATHAEYGPPSVPLHAACHWVMSEIACLGSSIPDHHFQIMQAGSVIHEAAATAYQFGYDIQAVEWLEQGQSVIWGQLLQLRKPIDDLEEKEPGLTLVERVSPLSPPLGPPKLLAIAQPSSIGQHGLPGTVDEIKYIKEAVEQSEVLALIALVEEKATLENIVSKLKTATWVYFACHGVQNPTHPTESALLFSR